MTFLSARTWLALWPRRLRFFAVALSLLAAIAPSWHVCAMSGHAMSGHDMAAMQHGGASHGVQQFTVARNADGSPGPYICACASHYDEKKVEGAALAPTLAAMGHVNCLALLLQNLPVQVAAPPALCEFAAPRAVYCNASVGIAAFEAPRAQRGRAPPLDV